MKTTYLVRERAGKVVAVSIIEARKPDLGIYLRFGYRVVKAREFRGLLAEYLRPWLERYPR